MLGFALSKYFFVLFLTNNSHKWLFDELSQVFWKLDMEEVFDQLQKFLRFWKTAKKR